MAISRFQCAVVAFVFLNSNESAVSARPSKSDQVLQQGVLAAPALRNGALDLSSDEVYSIGRRYHSVIPPRGLVHQRNESANYNSTGNTAIVDGNEQFQSFHHRDALSETYPL